MKLFKNGLLLLVIFFLISGCNRSNKKTVQGTTLQDFAVTKDTFKVPVKLVNDSIFNLNLNQELSDKSLFELRILRSSILARHGYCFMEADLRGYFESQTNWYDTLMFHAYDNNYDKDLNEWVTLTEEEAAFVKKVDQLIEEKLKSNYINTDGKSAPNTENIINLFQYTGIENSFMEKVKRNGFVMVPGNDIQLFHVYEKNDYTQTPSFVTTDLYLQVFHMYFSYLMKSIETKYLIDITKKLTGGLYKECSTIANTSNNTEIKEIADYLSIYAAVPSFIISQDKSGFSAEDLKIINQEIRNINNISDNFSEFLGYTEVYFPYSLFKPRGNYTRSEDLKKYFKSMMWLQIVPFCRDDEKEIKRAILLASVLNQGKSPEGIPLLSLYKNLFEPISFIIGEPDNLSVMDIAEYLSKEGINDYEEALNKSTQISRHLISIAENKNKIKPKIEMTCRDKINLIPQRYLIDNEILQELVDIKANAERAYPKGLDIFAAFGDTLAESILLKTHNENKNWDDYNRNLNKLKNKFSDFKGWNNTVYNKWIESLISLQKPDKDYPAFMQTSEWGKKNLNTALASWAELKHDAILYAEQPMAAECGDGGPPSPITVGYVEPNIHFWKKMIELIDLTKDMLERNQFTDKDITSKTNSLKNNAEFLLSASQKELNHVTLTEQEYSSIEIIGSTIEYLTLSIVEPDKYLQDWEDVKGPDKSIAVVADIYTRNVTGCEKNGILHVATGNTNDIYVVVEIEGYLYLTKGAAFSYYEFVRPLNERLTDEEWQKILEGNRVPAIPVWLKDILYENGNKPNADERIFYSSGC